MLKLRKTTTTLALLSGISMLGGAMLPVDAQAYTLMDMLKGRSREQSARNLPGVVTEIPSERAIRDPEPLPKVAPPKYFTYRADALRAVKTTGFAAASAADQTRFLAEARVSAPAEVATAVEAYYARNGAPLWVENGELTERARAVLATLKKAADYGLDPADYAVDEPQLTTASVSPDASGAHAPDAVKTYSTTNTAEAAPATSAQTAPPAGTAEAATAATTETAPAVTTEPAPVTTTEAAPAAEATAPAAAQAPAATVPPVAVENAPATQPAVTEPAAPQVVLDDSHAKELMQFDVALSAKVMLFAQDMVRGRLDPNRISEFHDFKRKPVQLAAIIDGAKTAPDVAAYLDGLAPNNAEFKALRNELAQLRVASEQDDAIKLPDDLLLKPGMSSPDLSNVVAAIQKKASEDFKTRQAEVIATYQQTPEYTPELVAFVKDFQKEAGLSADGVIGRGTVRALIGDSNEDKVGKLIVAMEQLRWLPVDLGDRHVMINQPSFRVAYYEHGTEQFSMRSVIGSKAHQTFFFQDKIKTVEFNPSWGVPQSIIVNEMVPKLRKDPSYLDRQGYEVAVNGRAVSSTSVDWYSSTNNISVRQPPSSDNALGDLKILFPNAHAIYMHDTPAKSFFKRDMRALSHGCVRLAEPRKMAAALLGISEKEVDARIANGRNAPTPVTADIPVYVAYFTAWPNKDGKVEYFGDVYDRDVATMKALAATSKARNPQA
ncbi:L,D-transpeptidase family protein [Neorhizobium sp. JUb45]|uniref:L,D-transpeptidase family protein n=1 Tax=Neorhizobium sp. JUb45 TaxID=2485113 RepID=UPI0010F0EB2B|nr:L,D-transpeptidase family protein [Neorhizobium sp. JUb45]TCR05002.1 murein L,D-transpeptidase YcbB/YkuD [Neorhizobium sp. JUb45]